MRVKEWSERRGSERDENESVRVGGRGRGR